MTSHASHAVSEEYNYDIHTVKRDVALSPISGKLTVHSTADHGLILSSTPLTHSRLGERHASI
jgi:hypothetical protein